MPMTFHHETDVLESFSVQPLSKQLSNLVAYFGRVATQHPSDERRDYNTVLRLETRFVRTASPEAIKVIVSKDPGATQITVTGGRRPKTLSARLQFAHRRLEKAILRLQDKRLLPQDP